jgi:adenosylhomocysteine nucleosidase
VLPSADPIAFICAMPMEVVPIVKRLGLRKQQLGDLTVHSGTLAGRGVVAIVTGMGPALATEGTERLLDAMNVDRVVVVGITGALENVTPIGSLIVPESVIDGATGSEHVPAALGKTPPHGKMLTSDHLITASDRLEELRAEGIVSLDMETAAIAEVCEKRDVPWSVFRVISDRASDGSISEEEFRLSNMDGTPRPGAVAKYFVRHPERIPVMARLARGAKMAAERAAETAIRACVEA